MKNITSLLFAIAVILIFTSSISIKKFNPAGEWKAVDDKSGINYIQFMEDGKMRVKADNNKFLPNNIALRYKFDFDKSPAWCDFIIYSLYGDKIGLLEGIVNIKSKDNFILKISNSSRPKKFDGIEGESIEFVRIKK